MWESQTHSFGLSDLVVPVVKWRQFHRQKILSVYYVNLDEVARNEGKPKRMKKGDQTEAQANKSCIDFVWHSTSVDEAKWPVTPCPTFFGRLWNVGMHVTRRLSSSLFLRLSLCSRSILPNSKFSYLFLYRTHLHDGLGYGINVTFSTRFTRQGAYS